MDAMLAFGFVSVEFALTVAVLAIVVEASSGTFAIDLLYKNTVTGRISKKEFWVESGKLRSKA